MNASNNEAKFPLSERVFLPHFETSGNFDSENTIGYTPNQLKRAYSFDYGFSGEGIKTAVISAFDNVALNNNMAVFNAKNGLADTEVQLFYPYGRTESTSEAWLVESSLDTQWIHAFAPSSEISVVFSPDARVENLLMCARYACKELSADIVCMCFGTQEGINDKQISDFFEDSECIFVASSGDVGGKVRFPSTSPFCISVGGTNLLISETSGRKVSETAWQNGGGGKSDVFEIPMYQGRFFNIYGMTDGMRGTPDVSVAANYNPGAAVYVSQLGGWTNVGGTSLAAACFSGVCACIKQKHPEIRTSTDMLSFLYNKAGGDGYAVPQYNFNDITVGKSGNNYAEKGWDFATGLGSPVINQILS